MFGREEIDEIIPAVEMAKETMKVYGPVPADSVFYQASSGSNKFRICKSFQH